MGAYIIKHYLVKEKKSGSTLTLHITVTILFPMHSGHKEQHLTWSANYKQSLLYIWDQGMTEKGTIMYMSKTQVKNCIQIMFLCSFNKPKFKRTVLQTLGKTEQNDKLLNIKQLPFYLFQRYQTEEIYMLILPTKPPISVSGV